jgi:alpha-L-fucosidase
VIGYAPVDVDINALLVRGDPTALGESPYTEWYENSLRFPSSSVSRYHRATYGDRPYRSFARDWEAALEHWDPTEWARRFARAGARYVVLVSKHHDGYCLWPTAVKNPRVPDWACPRDVVGELAEAVRAEGMRFGLYYSGGLDWTFNSHPIGSFSDLSVAMPTGDYVAYADAQVRELIARYEPSVLWNDISWPSDASGLFTLFEHYYERVPDGVVNDRWIPRSAALEVAKLRPSRAIINRFARRQAALDKGMIPPKPPFCDVRTPEYTVFPEIQRQPWECVRGIDHSFGYNAASPPENFVTERDLLWSVVDIAAKNGNLLLNVGPRGEDATIPDVQYERLEWLGALMHDRDGAGLRETRPWVTPGDATVEGADVRYTARGEQLHVWLRGSGDAVTLAEVAATPTTRAEGGRVEARSDGLRVTLDTPLDPDRPSLVTLTNVRARAHSRE